MQLHHLQYFSDIIIQGRRENKQKELVDFEKKPHHLIPPVIVQSLGFVCSSTFLRRASFFLKCFNPAGQVFKKERTGKKHTLNVIKIHNENKEKRRNDGGELPFAVNNNKRASSPFCWPPPCSASGRRCEYSNNKLRTHTLTHNVWTIFKTCQPHALKKGKWGKTKKRNTNAQMGKKIWEKNICIYKYNSGS